MAKPKPYVPKKKSSGKKSNKNTIRSPPKTVKNSDIHIPLQYYPHIKWLAKNHKNGYKGKAVPGGKTAGELEMDEEIIEFVDFITKKMKEQIKNGK